MGKEELRHQPRRIAVRAGWCAVLAVVGASVATPIGAATKKAKVPVTATSTEPAAKTFCEGWAQVRAVRSTGLTGTAVLRLQAERYRVLVGLAPKDLQPQVKVMADYFTTTLAMADKPLNNAKQSAALEALIPKIGDALTAVTRHAVRTCPRSLVRTPTTTIDPSRSTTSVPPAVTKKR